MRALLAQCSVWGAVEPSAGCRCEGLRCRKGGTICIELPRCMRHGVRLESLTSCVSAFRAVKKNRPVPTWVEGVAWPLLAVCLVVGTLAVLQSNWLLTLSMLCGVVLWSSFIVRSRSSKR